MLTQNKKMRPCRHYEVLVLARLLKFNNKQLYEYSLVKVTLTLNGALSAAVYGASICSCILCSVVELT